MTALDRRRLLLASGAGAASLALPGLDPAASGAREDRPITIPAVRGWRPRAGRYELPRHPRIVLGAHDAGLLDTAHLLAGELEALTGRRVVVEVDGRAPREGEIRLARSGPPRLGREGYRLSVDRAVGVVAPSAAGVYYGTRTLLQLLARSTSVPRGDISDRPRYGQRAVMLDCGRKHLPAAWIADRIREMGYLKLNYLHLHFTDDQGWRIESDQRPRVHSDRGVLTKREVRDLVALAARHHVTVVPEIDLPGHLTEGLRHHPELQLTDPLGQPNPGKLDYTKPAARRFARDLVTEYLPLFPGRWWHLGGDEFLNPVELQRYPQLLAYGQARHGLAANAHDGTIDFVNELAALVRRHGKQPRAWADGIGGGNVARLDRDVVCEWWTDVSPLGDQTALPSPAQLRADGYRVMNCSFYPTYLFYRADPQPVPDLRGFYEGWRVHRFRGAAYLDGTLATPYQQLDPDDDGLVGAKLHLWNDDPTLATPAEEADALAPRLRIMAQKTWETPRLVESYAEFGRLVEEVGGPPPA